jgi:hypothetical protein
VLISLDVYAGGRNFRGFFICSLIFGLSLLFGISVA